MKNKKENIAEYILYLWQIEDYLRAFPGQAEANQELRELSEMMHREGVVEAGHVPMAANALRELEELHAYLFDREARYRAAAIQLAPALAQLKAKTDRPTMSDVEACLVLLYQIMLLRLRGQAIGAETEAVQRQATELLQHLSRWYRDGDKQEEAYADQGTL